MNNKLNPKIRAKLVRLNMYLEEELNQKNKSLQFWEERFKEHGDIVIDSINNIKYADMVEKIEVKIRQLQKDIQENKNLIQELRKR